MALDGKILRRARRTLGGIKAANERELARRREEAFASIPEFKELDAKMRRISFRLVACAMQEESAAEREIAALGDEFLDLQAMRAELLVGAGYPADYLDEIYSCGVCRDCGYTKDGEMCSCLTGLYAKESAMELSNLFRMGSEAFENFDPGYYSTQPDESGESPRECMETVLETCLNFAYRFGPGSVNLLFQGGTGLGKTFLSASIARVVSDRGFSVVYETAVSAFETFESQKFSKSQEQYSRAGERLRRYLECDLFILDDLGTEMSTSFTESALYTLINSRLVSGKKTIISTNLPIRDLRRRYSAQVMSRLEGEYLNLSFKGSDIRMIKKERGLT